MKKLFLLLTVTSLFFGCTEEQIEQVQENAIVGIMTNGQWTMKSFTVNGVNKTADFATYKFQFKKDNTVDALLISNNSVASTGTWSGSISPSPTITSAFPGTANATLLMLNATWTITNTGNGSPVFVEASTTVNSEVRTMRMERL